MRKKLLMVGLTIFLIVFQASPAHATMPTFDAINATLQGLQNAILNSSFAQNIALAMDHLSELKAQTTEFLRFHSGLDDILSIVRGDPIRNFIESTRKQIQGAFPEVGSISPQIEILQTGGTAEDIRSSLETITGLIPKGNARAYIPFDEMQVVEAFQMASQIRAAGKETRDAASQIQAQAIAASPKGAARLQAQGVSELMVLGQANQEAIAKLLELEATQIEQVSRREKEAERERLRFLKDSQVYLDAVLGQEEGGF